MFYAEDILHRGEVKRCNWKIQRRMFGITLLNLQKKELHLFIYEFSSFHDLKKNIAYA